MMYEGASARFDSGTKRVRVVVTALVLIATLAGLLSGSKLMLIEECHHEVGLPHEPKHWEEYLEGGFWSLRSPDRLYRAKMVIEDFLMENVVADDLHDDGFLYHNLSQFLRSYAVMERVLRIYVYEEGYRPLVHQGPTTGIYASEGLFISSIEQSIAFTTRDPAQATLFFIPFSLKKMVDHLFDPESHNMRNIQVYIANYIRSLAIKYPYVDRHNGTDHFFVSCHDWALQAFERHEQIKNNAVKVVCNADISRGFHIARDVSLPETRITKRRRAYDETMTEPAERPFLAFFAGQMHGKLRPRLLKHWQNRDQRMKIYGMLPPSNLSYSQHMRLSKYCICAAGFEVNSPRLVESITHGCVPVIIADNFVLPFSETINWKSISVSVAERDVPDLKRILAAISDDRYREMQARLKHVKRHFEWNESPRKYDIFTMILHSLWTQTLKSTGPLVKVD